MASTIFRYSAICSRTESPCSEATSFLTSGFLAINDGFVVCPSRNPRSLLMRCVSSESPPSSNILVLVRGMVLPFRSSGIDDEKRRWCFFYEHARGQTPTGLGRNTMLVGPFTAFRLRHRQSNSFQVLDQILLVGIAELQVELGIVVIHHVQQRGEPSIMVESTLLMRPQARQGRSAVHVGRRPIGLE